MASYVLGKTVSKSNPMIAGTLTYAGPNGVSQVLTQNLSLIKIPSSFFLNSSFSPTSSRPYSPLLELYPEGSSAYFYRFAVFKLQYPITLDVNTSFSVSFFSCRASSSDSDIRDQIATVNLLFYNIGSSATSEVSASSWTSAKSLPSSGPTTLVYDSFTSGLVATHVCVFIARNRSAQHNSVTTAINTAMSSDENYSIGVTLTPTFQLASDQFIDENTSPYWATGHTQNTLKISALPFRAYEAIYNCYYRNLQNDPFKINGVQEPNKLITTDAGGPDTTQYRIMYRQWAPDQFTTAVQSPQAGVAPLVGITTNGTMSFSDDAGNVYKAQAEIDEDGDTIKSFKVLSEDMPQGNLRALVDMATSGISISDLRNVNSLQRWLEINLRKQFRYRDLLKGHFGVSPSYNTVQYPEFIGAVSSAL